MTTKIIGDKALKRKLNSLADLKFLRPTMKQIGTHVKGKASKYPPVSRRPQPFKTPEQRRGFFYHLRKGDIEVPYRRGTSPGSETLDKKWTFRTDPKGTGVTIANNASYGPLVQGNDAQTDYHRGTGWKTTEQIAKEEEETVLKEVQKAVDRELAKG